MQGRADLHLPRKRMGYHRSYSSIKQRRVHLFDTAVRHLSIKEGCRFHHDRIRGTPTSNESVANNAGA
jgi:hypothetical protein